MVDVGVVEGVFFVFVEYYGEYCVVVVGEFVG